MTYSYLYIDDNVLANASGIIAGLEEKGKLEIRFTNPEGIWEEERERIKSVEFAKYNGLILDLNLEETPNTDKKISFYKGSSLAQEIRNISKAGEIREIPIILLSATVNLDKYFDKTNEDLFDLIISREALAKKFVSTRRKLISLARGYELIEKCKKDNDFNDLLRRDLGEEDLRFVGEIKSVFEYPVHTITNFLVKHVLDRNGVLVDENLVATRLGIDIKSEGWGHVRECLDDAKYMGVFSDGWCRWWMNIVEYWWSNTIGSKANLRSLKASERVDIIKAKLNIENLKAIEKSEKARSFSFWTNCVGSGIAIDTIDGLLIVNQDNLFSWQEKKYISFEEGLKPTNKEVWKKISPVEDFKLEQLKTRYPNERQKR